MIIDRLVEPVSQPRPARGVIYVIRAEGTNLYKIGFSGQSAESRRSDMQTGNPYELSIVSEVPGTREDERLMHEVFCGERERGEWFELDARELWRAISILASLSSRRARSGHATVFADECWMIDRLSSRLAFHQTPAAVRVVAATPNTKPGALMEPIRSAGRLFFLCDRESPRVLTTPRKLERLAESLNPSAAAVTVLDKDLYRRNHPDSSRGIDEAARDLIEFTQEPQQ